jgi:hypothetical protein
MPPQAIGLPHHQRVVGGHRGCIDPDEDVALQ